MLDKVLAFLLQHGILSKFFFVCIIIVLIVITYQLINKIKINRTLMLAFCIILLLVTSLFVENTKSDNNLVILKEENLLNGDFNAPSNTKQYENKYISLIGHIYSINKDSLGTYVLLFPYQSSETPSDSGIKCYINKSDIALINGLQVGELTVIAGVYKGNNGTRLDNCNIRVIKFYDDYPFVPTFDSVTGIKTQFKVSKVNADYSKAILYNWRSGKASVNYVLYYCNALQLLGFKFDSDMVYELTSRRATAPMVLRGVAYAIYIKEDTDTYLEISRTDGNLELVFYTK
jgi:hypothetical protein